VGVRRILVLDLAKVGMGRGAGTEPLCRELRSLDRDLEIIAGGGVRSLADLRSLRAAGCNAALVASALHDGRLNAADCATLC
jgi:phosphoribosylformimino-5-aminoimidazole carboxamide ribotide isomerase